MYLLSLIQKKLRFTDWDGGEIMPFTLPVFNLDCRLTAGGITSFDTFCNLCFSRRNTGDWDLTRMTATPGTVIRPVYILFPAGTNVVGKLEAGANMQIVEVVIGSGRFYYIYQVEDSGKGFSNEHRVAICYQKQAFPIPIP